MVRNNRAHRQGCSSSAPLDNRRHWQVQHQDLPRHVVACVQKLEHRRLTTLSSVRAEDTVQPTHKAFGHNDTVKQTEVISQFCNEVNTFWDIRGSLSGANCVAHNIYLILLGTSSKLKYMCGGVLHE